MNWIFIVLLSSLLTFCNSYKVLFVAHNNAKSHFLYMSSFVRALLNRGHEVTYLTGVSLSHLNLKNYTEILVDPPFDIAKHIPQEKLIQSDTGSVFSEVDKMKIFPKMWNAHAYESANVQKFIKTTGLHFDVIVAEEFFQDSFYMFTQKYKAPIVTILPFGVTHFIDRQQGLISFPSFVPHWRLPYTDKMSFTERWFNTIVITYDWFIRNFYYLPTEEQFVKKYFAHLGPLPALKDIIQNVSITLVNTHRAIDLPRPSMPSIIPIGGAHIKSTKPLPENLRIFLDEAKHGVIYFSMGSLLKTSEMPKQFMQSVIATFRKLKQRVLWKYEDEFLTDIPSNVMIQKWMPQNDILAHSNVVLFIGHGGLFGTSESLYHGIPLLLIPFFGDQFRNAHRIETAGYGKFIKHQEITEELFTNAINEIISDESYMQKAKYTSAVYKDNLVHPMDEAMFWIEHVAKFKGAKHLKSHAVKLSWFTYLSLDVILVNLMAIFLTFYLLSILIKVLFQKKKIRTDINKKEK